MENELKKLPFDQIQILRPSLLLGPRRENRPLEKLATKMMPAISFLVPDAYKPVTHSAVAQAMRYYADQNTKGLVVIPNENLIRVPT
jgi:hypothetical protein